MQSVSEQDKRFSYGRASLRALHSLWAVVLMLLASVAPALAEDGAAVREPSPLHVTGSGSAEAGTPLHLEAGAYQRLQPHQKLHLTGFPLTGGQQVDLELEQFAITNPETRIVAGTDAGDVPIPPPDIALFRGHVSGDPGSHVVLGISPRGIHGFVWLGQQGGLPRGREGGLPPRREGGLPPTREGWVIAPLSPTESPASEANHGVHRMSDLRSLLPAEPPPAGTACGAQRPEAERRSPAAPAYQFRATRLALECDYEYWQQFNDFQDALDYIYLLFATISDMYERDVDVKLALTFIRIWTTASDPYSYVGGDDDGLREFKNHWNTYHAPGQPGFVERDLAHLLSSRSVGAWAANGVLCDYASGYSISGGNASQATTALSLVHDLEYAGHELGHNFNAQHTHCFNPPIDRCGVEPGCNQTQDCSTAPSTMMSYCHTCPGGGANILHEFHPFNVTRMRAAIDSSCLRLARNPTYVDWRNSFIELGTASWPYDTVKEGVEAVLPGGTVSIANGNYDEPIHLWQRMTLQATGGLVTIGE